MFREGGGPSSVRRPQQHRAGGGGGLPDHCDAPPRSPQAAALQAADYYTQQHDAYQQWLPAQFGGFSMSGYPHGGPPAAYYTLPMTPTHSMPSPPRGPPACMRNGSIHLGPSPEGAVQHGWGGTQLHQQHEEGRGYGRGSGRCACGSVSPTGTLHCGWLGGACLLVMAAQQRLPCDARPSVISLTSFLPDHIPCACFRGGDRGGHSHRRSSGQHSREPHPGGSSRASNIHAGSEAQAAARQDNLLWLLKRLPADAPLGDGVLKVGMHACETRVWAVWELGLNLCGGAGEAALEQCVTSSCLRGIAASAGCICWLNRLPFGCSTTQLFHTVTNLEPPARPHPAHPLPPPIRPGRYGQPGYCWRLSRSVLNPLPRIHPPTCPHPPVAGPGRYGQPGPCWRL